MVPLCCFVHYLRMRKSHFVRTLQAEKRWSDYDLNKVFKLKVCKNEYLVFSQIDF